jgi:hypothetical protein
MPTQFWGWAFFHFVGDDIIARKHHGTLFTAPCAVSLHLICTVSLCFAQTAPQDAIKGRICTGEPGDIPGMSCIPAELLEHPTCRSAGQDIEGKSLGSRCCLGLKAIAGSRLEQGQCQLAPPSVLVCARCGDGVCGKGENSCNCPADCGDRIQKKKY